MSALFLIYNRYFCFNPSGGKAQVIESVALKYMVFRTYM